MTHIQPNLTSNLPAVSRVDLVARQNPAPKRAVAEYTDAAGQMERAFLRAMIADAKNKSLPVKPESKKAKTAAACRMRTKDISDRIIAAIGAPKTAATIAAETKIPQSTVTRNLRRMATSGEIEAFAQPRHKSGQNRPFLYALNGTFANPYDFAARKSGPIRQDVRSAVLALLAKPHAAFEISNALGINRQKARYQIQCLAADGLIRPAGTADTFRAKRIQQWVAK